MLQYMTAMREEVLYEVFVDLRKVYYALDQERCMDIMVAYEVVLQMELLIRIYWEGLTMVSRAGLYYGSPFKGSRGSRRSTCCLPPY